MLRLQRLEASRLLKSQKAKRKARKQPPTLPPRPKQKSSPKSMAKSPAINAKAPIVHPGLVVRTPAGSDGPTHTHSIPGSIASRLSMVSATSSGRQVLIIVSARQHTNKPAIIGIQYTTALEYKKAYPRTEVLSAADMDDESASYKLNAQHVKFRYTGNPLTRVGSLHVLNPTSSKVFDSLQPSIGAFCTTPSETNLNNIITAVLNAPQTKTYSMNENMTIDIAAPSMQNWTINGDDNLMFQSKFSTLDGALTEVNSMINNTPINTDFTFNGTEIFMVYDGFGNTTPSANSVNAFMVEQLLSVEQHSALRLPLLGPALPKHPDAAAALHGITQVLHEHNMSITDSTPPLTHLRSHPSNSSVLSAVGKFAWKNRKTEESIGLSALALL